MSEQMTRITAPSPDHAAPRPAGRPRRRLGRLAGEDGFVIIVVMAVLFVGLALGAVAVAESLSSQDIGKQDQHERRAQQATDAGIQSQLYQQGEANIMSSLSLAGGPLNLATALDCLVPQLNVATGQLTGGLVTGAVSAAGVCPGSSTGGVPSNAIPVQAVGNHAYNQSEFIPGGTTLNGGTLYPKIVSLGWDDTGGTSRTVYSRQEAILAPIAPLRTLEAQGNLTVSGLSLLGLGASTAYGNISANGNLTTPTAFVMANLDNLAAGILGSASYGGSYSGFLTVPAPTHTTTPVVRQPVSVSSAKASCPDAANACTYTAGVRGISTGYNAATDTFSLSSGQTATFAPGDYVLCSFNAATGSTVNAAPTAATPVRIFIDSPTSARCDSTVTNAALNQYNDKLDANRGNFVAGNGIVNGLLGLGGVVASSSLQVYVVGTQNKANTYDNGTTVRIGTDCAAVLCTNQLTQSMILYAPTSSVSLYTGACVQLLLKICTGGVFDGALIGDDVNAQALSFSENLAIGNFPLYNGVQVYHPIQYIQCSSQPYSGATKYTQLQADATIDTNGC